MTEKGTRLPRRKSLAILTGFFLFQLLFFPFNKEKFGFISIPFFGTLGFLLTIVTAHLVNFLAFKMPEDSRGKYIKAAVVISLVSVFASIFRASFTDRFLLSALASFWWLIAFYLFIIPKGKFGAFSEIAAIPLRLISPIFTSAVKLIDLVSRASIEGSKTGKYISKIVIGLIITIPAAGVLLMLLSSADPIFGSYVEKTFTFDFTLTEFAAQILWRAFFSICVLVFLGVLVFMKITSNFVSPATTLHRKNSHLIGPYLMLTITLSIILSLFLAIQFKYLFAIESLKDLTEFGIPTFSEYVRKGFTELIFATGIVYAVSGAGLILYRSFKPHKIHLFVNSLLIILNLALAAMAYRRVYLYMTEHGLTHMRIYGIMVLLIIVLFLVTLFFRYFKRNHKLYLVELTGASLIVFLFGIANVDYLLARVAPPTVNNEVDFNYLSRLSADDPESWIKVYEDIKKDTLPLLEKENLTLDDRILILRSSWAIGKIYHSVGTLTHKYGSESEGEILDYTYYPFNREKSILKFNVKEYSAFLTFKDEVNLKELRELQDKINQKGANISLHGDIPYDVYQFYY